jgi:glycosyltransferase involved in cell wall biosynthesis
MLHVPEAYLKIIGEGPQERILRDLCERLGLQNVEFLGPKWGTEMNLFLAKARFTVVPSLWHENLPYVILQSFAMGKTVIGSNRGGIPELIEHGVRGLTYEATDIKALADSIRQLWNHPHYAVEMGKAAKKYVDAEFNDEKFYGSLMAIYSEVLQ